MGELKREIFELIDRKYKIGDKFKAIKNECDVWSDYSKDDICELISIDYGDLNRLFRFKNLHTNESFWLHVRNTIDFEKIGE